MEEKLEFDAGSVNIITEVTMSAKRNTERDDN